jgi:pyrroline-5-carboxylate reductase
MFSMTNPFPKSLVLVGAGKMGGAMLEGWIASGLPGSAVTVIDPLPSQQMAAYCSALGIAVNPPAGSIAAPEVLVLGIKPQMLDAAAPTLALLAGPHTLVLSILAGKTVANLKARLPEARSFVRAMPNLPASVGRGITGAVANAEVSTEQKAVADTLLKGVGRVEWVDREALIDAVTGVSGSGPAYVFHLVECLAKAGEAEGLPPDLALRLARATVEGAGELLFKSDLSAATLRQNVTSPGGTTAAGLQVLMGEGGLEPLIAGTVHAARRRAAELSG